MRVIGVMLMVWERNLRRYAGVAMRGNGELRCAMVVCGVMVRQTVAQLGAEQRHAQQKREQSACNAGDGGSPHRWSLPERVGRGKETMPLHFGTTDHRGAEHGIFAAAEALTEPG